VPYHPKFQNRLLARLPTEEIKGLLPHLEPIELPLGFLVVPAGHSVDYVYFLEGGLGSIVAVSPKGQKAEAGMFGLEAFAPTSPAVGLDLSVHEVVIQSPGKAHRIEVASLWKMMGCCPVLVNLLHRASHNLSTQISYTALSNGVHKIDKRLARWLLMCQDRVGSNIEITHDYIALMLAVRRPGVTEALHVLEGEGFIRSERKHITIRNRPALEEFAREAYGVPEEEYKQLFPVPHSANTNEPRLTVAVHVDSPT
jgi:CRP-like cAMP-binding protein